MTARMRLARPNAQRGEIFGDAEPIFKTVINEDKALRTLRDRRAVMEEVPPFDPPKVNAAYPEKLPLATLPPLILDQFPRLPEGRLEYRFMGNDLIIRDVKANLVADFINNAVPTPKKWTFRFRRVISLRFRRRPYAHRPARARRRHDGWLGPLGGVSS